jgi:hypothetical protein
MLGIVSMAGNALKAFGNTHPAVKWGVIVLAFLLAAEFVGKEGISLYRDMATVQPTVERSRGEAEKTAAEGRAAEMQVLVTQLGNNGWTNIPMLKRYNELRGFTREQCEQEHAHPPKLFGAVAEQDKIPCNQITAQ